jgi:2-polyprenyl-3-methyl-5-hydroxy-6-metoxy-1,4-benzoquinol methylase
MANTYFNLTTGNRSILKRFSHRSRFRIALQLVDPKPGETIMDFGTGDGQMLVALKKAEANCRVIGYEPVAGMFAELETRLAQESEGSSIEIYNVLDKCPTKVDKILCFEVFEHLSQDRQYLELLRLKSRLAVCGKIIVSVPIEIGFASVLKNIARLILRQSHGNTGVRTIWRSGFGLPIARGDAEYLHSHIGFYYPNLEEVFLKVGLIIIRRYYSPIPIFGGFINSQIFYVLDKTPEL